MGGSGSGKSSFLNIIGARLALSPGCTSSGKVMVNNRVVRPVDFGKFGAFVQQDDILLDAFTVEETLRFAAKLKTSLNYEGREEKINDIIDRLGLDHCRHTRIGNALVKGVSGGERKRVSIGFELITDPTLLLCDEPSSGLDSSTSLKILKMLKDEARFNHLTILCTIHMPSAELFHTFDRLLLLQDGYQVY